MPPRPLLAFLLALLAGGAAAEELLVRPGADGRLAYIPYANRGATAAVNVIPDFSHCGYRGGGIALPEVPVAVQAPPPGGGDDHAALQAAIDAASALPPGPDGLRGAVLLAAGTYRIAAGLVIRASGVVLRGRGQHPYAGTRILVTATTPIDAIQLRGEHLPAPDPAVRSPIADPLVPVGARSFALASAAGFRVGDAVLVHRLVDQRWIEEVGAARYNWPPDLFQGYAPRTIAAIDGERVTLDAPLVQAIEARLGGGALCRAALAGPAVERVGVEDLWLESAYAHDADEAHACNAVVLAKVRDAWVRRVTARHFINSCVLVADSAYVTVEDCAQLDPKAKTAGARKYSFCVDKGAFVLVQRTYARGGRHDYVTGSRVEGPVAFVDGVSEEARNDTGPHHRFATGLLFDNLRTARLNVQNRGANDGHGWAGAQTLFWNCQADSLVVQAPPGAMNWAIGCIGAPGKPMHEGQEPGIVQSAGVPVAPRSLYYAQLRDRLGPAAVAAVTTPAQRQGRIWDDLARWMGIGRPPTDGLADRIGQ